VPDMHLRVLRQVARLRRRQLRDAHTEDRSNEGRAARLRDAENAGSRADAQLAAATARRRLDREEQ
jgi:hypothetical protein